MASIKVLATLLPDEILNDMAKNIREYETAVLFPDVSGKAKKMFFQILKIIFKKN